MFLQTTSGVKASTRVGCLGHFTGVGYLGHFKLKLYRNTCCTFISLLQLVNFYGSKLQRKMETYIVCVWLIFLPLSSIGSSQFSKDSRPTLTIEVNFSFASAVLTVISVAVKNAFRGKENCTGKCRDCVLGCFPKKTQTYFSCIWHLRKKKGWC